MALSSSGQDASISGGNRGSNPLRATWRVRLADNLSKLLTIKVYLYTIERIIRENLKTPHTGRRLRTTTSVVTWVRIPYTLLILRDRAEVARKAHNLEVIGSIPIPATKLCVF